MKNVLVDMAVQANDLTRLQPKRKHQILTFDLPIPVSINHMYSYIRGKRVMNQKAITYTRTVRAKMHEIMEEENWHIEDKGVWIYLDLYVYMPDRKRRDSHNMLKILLDACQDIVFHDDYYVMPRIQAVEYDKENPRIVLVLKKQDPTNRKGLRYTEKRRA